MTDLELDPDLLTQVATIDPAERAMLTIAILGSRPSPDTPLRAVLATIRLLHAVGPDFRQTEQERLEALVRAIAEADAIRDHERENGGVSL